MLLFVSTGRPTLIFLLILFLLPFPLILVVSEQWALILLVLLILVNYCFVTLVFVLYFPRVTAHFL